MPAKTIKQLELQRSAEKKNYEIVHTWAPLTGLVIPSVDCPVLVRNCSILQFWWLKYMCNIFSECLPTSVQRQWH